MALASGDNRIIACAAPKATDFQDGKSSSSTHQPVRTASGYLSLNRHAKSHRSKVSSGNSEMQVYHRGHRGDTEEILAFKLITALDNSTISGTSQCHTANQPAPASVRLSFSFRQTTSGKIRIMIPTMNHDQQDCQFFLCAFSVPPVVNLHSKTAKRIVTSVFHWMSVEKQKITRIHHRC